MVMNPKREHLRHTIQVPVKVEVIGRKEEKVWKGRGTIANIGGGGILLELVEMDEQTAQKLVENEYVFQLTFSLPDLWLKLRAVAEVAWTKPGVNKRQFGVTFKNLPEKNKRKITKCVEGWVINELVDRAFQRAVEDFRKKSCKTEKP